MLTAHTVGERVDAERELKEASNQFALEPTEHDSKPVRVFWELAALSVVGAISAELSGGHAGIGGGIGFLTQAARSLPTLVHDVGPKMFGRGAFDLARRVRREVSQVEHAALLAC